MDSLHASLSLIFPSLPASLCTCCTHTHTHKHTNSDWIRKMVLMLLAGHKHIHTHTPCHSWTSGPAGIVIRMRMTLFCCVFIMWQSCKVTLWVVAFTLCTLMDTHTHKGIHTGPWQMSGWHSALTSFTLTHTHTHKHMQSFNTQAKSPRSSAELVHVLTSWVTDVTELHDFDKSVTGDICHTLSQACIHAHTHS